MNTHTVIKSTLFKTGKATNHGCVYTYDTWTGTRPTLHSVIQEYITQFNVLISLCGEGRQILSSHISDSFLGFSGYVLMPATTYPVSFQYCYTNGLRVIKREDDRIFIQLREKEVGVKIDKNKVKNYKVIRHMPNDERVIEFEVELNKLLETLISFGDFINRKREKK